MFLEQCSWNMAERVVRLLATGDSRLDLPDTAGRTVLHHASALLGPSLRARLVTALVEAGAPLTCRWPGIYAGLCYVSVVRLTMTWCAMLSLDLFPAWVGSR